MCILGVTEPAGASNARTKRCQLAGGALWPWCMEAFPPSADPVSVEATIDSYRRLRPKSYLSALAARNVFRLLLQIDQVA